jgi:uncharacterized protein involved in exopolysaccharide biosynthesis
MSEQSGQNPDSAFVFSHWEVFQPLRRHLSFIVVFTLSATLSALLLTYIFSEKYEAQMTILLKPQEITRLRDHDTQALGAPLPQAEYKVVGQTLQDLAGSEPLLLAVVKTLKLDVPEPRVYEGPFYSRWYKEAKDTFEDYGGNLWSILKYGRVLDPDPTASAVMTLSKNIKLENSDSNVFILKVRDKHPDRVAEITTVLANELVALLQKNGQGTAGTRSAELRDSLARKYKAIESDSEQINQLMSNYHAGSIAEETDKLTGEYAEIESSWLTAQSDIKQNSAMIGSFSEKLANPANIGRGGQRLQADDYKKMASDRLNTEVNLHGLRDKSAALKGSLGQISARLQQLSRAQVEYELIDATRQRDQRDYSLINDALQEELLQEGNSATSLIITGPAVASNQPTTPIKIYHVLLALALGLLFSVGVAFVFGYFDIRFFMTPEQKDRQQRRELEPEPRVPYAHPMPTVAD